MKSNYDDEATLYMGYENEETKIENVSNAKQETGAHEPHNAKAKSGGMWKRAAAGAGAGLLIGGVATVLTSMKSAAAEAGDEAGDNNNKEVLSHPEWVDDQMQVATTVNDDMSFGEAFAAARAEVGPGGCFEWHGQVYGTYTAAEWNSMSAEQRAEYGSHFSWNHIDHSSSNVAHHTSGGGNSNAQDQGSHDVASNDGDDIEVISINHENGNNDLAQGEDVHSTGHSDGLDLAQTDPEIEILGVVHDSDTGANIGGMTVDGQEVILIDVDGDMEFDYMAYDMNGDGQMNENELMDIQGQGLCVNDMGGLSDPGDNMLASNDMIDYSTDGVYEG